MATPSGCGDALLAVGLRADLGEGRGIQQQPSRLTVSSLSSNPVGGLAEQLGVIVGQSGVVAEYVGQAFVFDANGDGTRSTRWTASRASAPTGPRLRREP